ncbi:helix-turn-helix domain-containing protein [Gracilibacillus phocaeensis]|uniref:helix-turn-helix domain-containing protein n=1 Tax=Gracilibacillus phocaeensis TaxID=2042304 RepID=UPI0013EF247A|nr:AraC family transcriptional regulator [Gracilibacillus phocaeensis]
MQFDNLTDYTLQLLWHTYWKTKEQFDRSIDTYQNWVMFAVESGSFHYEIGREKGIASDDDIILCPPGQAFKRKIITPLALHFIGYNIQTHSKDELLLPQVKVTPKDRKRLSSNFSYLRRLHLSLDKRSTSRKQWIINDIWQLICDELEADPIQHNAFPSLDSQDDLMNRAADWILKHAYEPIHLKELAEKIGLSPVQLTRRFQQAFRMTPTELIKRLRMHRAAKLLLDTNLTLEQISEKCGYDNGFYLSRVFTNFMNITPSKYREENYL